MNERDSALHRKKSGASAAAGVDARVSANAGLELAEARAELCAARREVEEMREALAAAFARERVLARELQHRVRNMLAVIRTIYRRTRESGGSQDEFAEHFQGRLDAVARYNSSIEDIGQAAIDLEDMLRDELLEAQCLDRPGCTISGPAVILRQKSAELMALAIHELTTNSIKFGALAQNGRLTVEWAVEDGLHGDQLHFRWIEAGVAPVSSAPRPTGFGRQLIEEALPYQLGATTAFHLKPGGMECSIRLPIAAPDGTGPDPERTAADE